LGGLPFAGSVLDFDIVDTIVVLVEGAINPVRRHFIGEIVGTGTVDTRSGGREVGSRRRFAGVGEDCIKDGYRGGTTHVSDIVLTISGSFTRWISNIGNGLGGKWGFCPSKSSSVFLHNSLITLIF